MRHWWQFFRARRLTRAARVGGSQPGAGKVEPRAGRGLLPHPSIRRWTARQAPACNVCWFRGRARSPARRVTHRPAGWRAEWGEGAADPPSAAGLQAFVSGRSCGRVDPEHRSDGYRGFILRAPPRSTRRFLSVTLLRAQGRASGGATEQGARRQPAAFAIGDLPQAPPRSFAGVAHGAKGPVLGPGSRASKPVDRRRRKTREAPPGKRGEQALSWRLDWPPKTPLMEGKGRTPHRNRAVADGDPHRLPSSTGRKRALRSPDDGSPSMGVDAAPSRSAAQATSTTRAAAELFGPASAKLPRVIPALATERLGDSCRANAHELADG